MSVDSTVSLAVDGSEAVTTGSMVTGWFSAVATAGEAAGSEAATEVSTVAAGYLRNVFKPAPVAGRSMKCWFAAAGSPAACGEAAGSEAVTKISAGDAGDSTAAAG